MDTCKNCGLPVAVLLSTEVSETIWHHPTIAREVNVDGAEVMVATTFCPNDLGEAEPRGGSDGRHGPEISH